MGTYTERDSARFDRALSEVEAHGGGVRLTSWPKKKQSKIPESSANWCDIATMLRNHIVDTNSGASITVIPKGRASEEFEATWKKATREARENETSLGEDAMDTLIFRDQSAFHFDCWSEGEPYVLVSDAGIKNGDSSENKGITKWVFDHIIGVVLAGVILAAALSWLGLSGS